MSDLSEKDKKNIVKVRLLEGAREAGVLLIVFSPLDVVLSLHEGGCVPAGVVCAQKEPWAVLWFLVGGLALFLASVFVERRYHNAD